MPYITVREALGLPELQSLELLAGEAGLGREIKDVTVLEVPDPEPWLKGGELILTAFYGLRGDNRAQVRLVKTVASVAAGICFNPGPGVPLEPEVLETADKLSLPILRMPGDMPYAKVISTVLQAILNRQAYLLNRSSEISSMMIKGILNGAESKEIVAILARLLRNPVALLDRSLNPVAEDPYGEEGRDLLRTGLPLFREFDVFSRVKQPEEFPVHIIIPFQGQEVRVAVQAVMIKSSVFGYLTAWELLKLFDEVDRLAVAHASTAIALDYIRRISLAEQQQKMVDRIMEEILSGNFASEKMFVQQGEALEMDISRLNIVLVVQAESLRGDTPGFLKNREFFSATDELVNKIKTLVEAHYPNGLVSIKNGEIAIVLGAGEGRERKKAVLTLAAEIQSACRKIVGQASVLIGAGSFVSKPDQLTQSYIQAKAAVNMAKNLYKGKTEVAFDDLGIYRLFSGLPCAPAMRRYVEMVLPGAETCGENILETLEAYLECGKSLTATGKHLYIHPNTVKYRLRKAKQLWGEHILLDQNCIDTIVALKLKRFLDLVSSD
jgi:sugar diacid utilization regulator